MTTFESKTFRRQKRITLENRAGKLLAGIMGGTDTATSDDEESALLQAEDANYEEGEETSVESPQWHIAGMAGAVCAAIALWKYLARYDNLLVQSFGLSPREQEQKTLLQWLFYFCIVTAITLLFSIIHFYFSHRPTIQATEERILVICPRCRARNNEDQKFCGQCGETLTTTKIAT